MGMGNCPPIVVRDEFKTEFGPEDGIEVRVATSEEEAQATLRRMWQSVGSQFRGQIPAEYQ